MTAPCRPGGALASCLLLALLLGGAASDSVVEQLTAQIAHLRAEVATVPQIRHLAVLLDDQQQPAMLVTSDPRPACCSCSASTR